MDTETTTNSAPLHYVCTGSCGYVSSGPGFCEAQYCSKEGKLLEPCNCTDGSHDHAGKIQETTEGEEPVI